MSSGASSSMMPPTCPRCGHSAYEIGEHGICVVCELTIAIIKRMAGGHFMLNQDRGEYRETDVTQKTKASAAWN